MNPGAQEDEDRPNQQPNDKKQAHLALVHQMAEPLTALAAYLNAASDLLRPDAPSSRKELVEIIEKSLAQTRRAREVLQQMRELLHQKE